MKEVIVTLLPLAVFWLIIGIAISGEKLYGEFLENLRD